MAPQLWGRGREETTGEGLTGLAVSSFIHLLNADHMPGLGWEKGFRGQDGSPARLGSHSSCKTQM